MNNLLEHRERVIFIRAVSDGVHGAQRLCAHRLEADNDSRSRKREGGDIEAGIIRSGKQAEGLESAGSK